MLMRCRMPDYPSYGECLLYGVTQGDGDPMAIVLVQRNGRPQGEYRFQKFSLSDVVVMRNTIPLLDGEDTK